MKIRRCDHSVCWNTRSSHLPQTRPAFSRGTVLRAQRAEAYTHGIQLERNSLPKLQ